MNYFDPKEAAARYAKGRPDFHANSIAHMKAYLRLEEKVDAALDIACGTGLSTKALTAIAEKVYGTDSSQEMLNNAAGKDTIQYTLARAEQQPFDDQQFDLITVCSGVHWFAIDRFLQEANRLLKSHAWLVLYENHFISVMEGNEAFTRWFPDVYLKKFPSPPRNNEYVWTNEQLLPKNFILQEEEKFRNPVQFTKKQLAYYFTTQSNIIAAVENKQGSYVEAEDWLHEELSAFFPDDETTQTLYYGNWIKYLQRAD